MLALVDGHYRFRWVDVGTAVSCSDTQIFNTCHIKRKTDPAPITQGGATEYQGARELLRTLLASWSQDSEC